MKKNQTTPKKASMMKFLMILAVISLLVFIFSPINTFLFHVSFAYFLVSIFCLIINSLIRFLRKKEMKSLTFSIILLLATIFASSISKQPIEEQESHLSSETVVETNDSTLKENETEETQIIAPVVVPNPTKKPVDDVETIESVNSSNTADNNPSENQQQSNSQSIESFKNCTLLREKYPDGVAQGHPAYSSKHDRDKDGWAYER